MHHTLFHIIVSLSFINILSHPTKKRIYMPRVEEISCFYDLNLSFLSGCMHESTNNEYLGWYHMRLCDFTFQYPLSLRNIQHKHKEIRFVMRNWRHWIPCRVVHKYWKRGDRGGNKRGAYKRSRNTGLKREWSKSSVASLKTPDFWDSSCTSR